MRDVAGVAVPEFMYGTAWKEERTAGLVRLALEAGFRAIDTANQRKHYHEAGVGQALREAFAEGLVTRDELFLQTKFTFLAGQDHRLPYDPDADFTTQVRQSCASSLEHLGVERLDSYVLHGPSTRPELGAADFEVWRAFEALHDEGEVRLLGVSNVSLEQLRLLHEAAAVKPSFVQNRCYADRGWDRAVRDFCRAEGIVYQGFSLLTANRRELAGRPMRDLCARLGKTPAQVVFRFAQQVGMLPLTGTTSRAHMDEDLAGGFSLSEDDLRRVEGIAEV